jgi:hypothetical protein
MVLNLDLPPLLAETRARFDQVLAFLPALEQCEARERWHRVVFKGLLLEAEHGFCNVLEALNTGDLRRLAWATRSLMEIKLWSKYVIISEDNARRLDREYDVDLKNIWRVFEPIFSSEPGRAILSQIIPEFDKAVEGRMAELGWTENEQYTRMKKLATEVGLVKEYETVNTLLSKLVHATGLSILANRDGFASLAQLMAFGGYTYCNEILKDIQEHLPTLGLPAY